MRKLCIFMPLFVLSIISVALLTNTSAFAATPMRANPNNVPMPKYMPTGNDISWPQCGETLPQGQAFGIVGVNDGLANTTNPCFATELAWANTSLGTTGQPKAALYINTADPGNLGVSDWPTSGKNIYGTCNGVNDQACAYQYGWDKAQEDTGRIGSNNPASYMWWLDVETNSSWETNKANNVADLEGVAAYFEGQGGRVGVYSNSSEWKQIAGSLTPGSNLYGLDSWLLGATSLSEAEANCKLPGLTAKSKVTITQFTTAQFDYDYACI